MPLQDEGLKVGEVYCAGEILIMASLLLPRNLLGTSVPKPTTLKPHTHLPHLVCRGEKMMVKLTTPCPKRLKPAASGKLNGWDL